VKSHEISEPTRRNIIDELTLSGISPSGRLDEVAFLSRMFDLTALPTTDYRKHQFPDMAADVWQHRINNSDWSDDWFWTDSRLDIAHASDETFLRFLAEMVHPLVRSDEGERQRLIELFNRHLAPEGWEVGAVSAIGAHTVYGARRLKLIPAQVLADARAVGQTLGDYVSQQVTRMDAALSGDPALAIGTAKELLETVCRTILSERKIALPKDDDLPKLVRLAITSLPVIPDTIPDKKRWEKTIERFVNNLVSTGQVIAELRNEFGTGHGKQAGHQGLQVHHTKFLVHGTTAIAVFLFEVHSTNP
jgi:hypothetical protein